jgi:hypothetical protein
MASHLPDHLSGFLLKIYYHTQCILGHFSCAYNADNMPALIVHSSNITTELTYGGTGERVKKRVYSGGNVTDTYYIGDHFEVKGGETIKYIFARNLRMAQVKGTTGAFSIRITLGAQLL